MPPYTASPGVNLLVFAPVWSITPENTKPRIGCRGLVTPIMSRNGTCNLALTCAERMKMSDAVTALAMIRTRTSSGFGDGVGTWQTRSTSGWAVPVAHDGRHGGNGCHGTHLTDVLVIWRAGRGSPPVAPGHLHPPPIGGLIASGQRPARCHRTSTLCLPLAAEG